MSDDIVARLRIIWTSCSDKVIAERTEAADEIERLRAERDALVEQRGRWIAATQLHAARANQQLPEIRRHWDSADA